MNKNRPQLVYLTNLPAPYRFPVWDAMAQRCSLKVVFLLKEKNWRNWPAPSNVLWNYEFLSLKSWKMGDFEFVPYYRHVHEILREIDFVFIGSWESPMYIRTFFAAKRLGIPVVLIYESTLKSQRFKSGPISMIRASLFKRANIVVSFGVDSSAALKEMGVPKNRIIELFNPADVSLYHKFSQNHREKESQGHKFLYVGQLIQRKNVKELIKAFAKIRNEFDTLTIVGQGKLLPELLSIVRRIGLVDCVLFLDQQDTNEIAMIYSTSNTLILPSTNEVWGLVVSEALAAGMHVVCNENCGVASFVKEMTGTFICHSDHNSIGQAMELSRSTWAGHLSEPEILNYTPEIFANKLMSALGSY